MRFFAVVVVIFFGFSVFFVVEFRLAGDLVVVRLAAEAGRAERPIITADGAITEIGFPLRNAVIACFEGTFVALRAKWFARDLLANYIDDPTDCSAPVK